MDLLAVVDHLHTPMLLLMLAIFCAIVAATYAPTRRREMDRRARIPLSDDR
jgi:cbb3-type cytochrome oxidase subunit 3